MTPHEDWFRKQLKVAYLDFASMEHTFARQHARIADLKDGDASTASFHRQCSFRRQKNRIIGLTMDGQRITDPERMAEAAFTHYDELLGTGAHRECTKDLTELIAPADLADLDALLLPKRFRRRSNGYLRGRRPGRAASPLNLCEPAGTRYARTLLTSSNSSTR